MNTKNNIIVVVTLGLWCLPMYIVFAQGCEKLIGSECAELRWEKTNAGVGEVAEITISPSDPHVMYAGFDANAHSFYKSENGGKIWRKMIGPGDHAQDVAVSSANPHTAYLVMSDIHTTDLSIKPSVINSQPRPANAEAQLVLSPGVTSGGPFSTLEIFEGNDDIVYAATRGSNQWYIQAPALFKTENKGANWQTIPTTLPIINVVAIDPQDADVIYVGSSDGIYASRDGGATMQRIRQENNVISLEVAKENPQMIVAATPDTIIRSLDGGRNWSDVTGKLSHIHRVRIARSNANIWYSSTFNGVFRSDNQGNVWKDVSGNLKGKNIHIVTIHPANPDIAFIGHSSLWGAIRARGRYPGYQGILFSDQGIFKTEDGGRTWSRSDSGIEEYNFEEVAASPSRLHEAWFAGVASVGGHKTNDAGQSWHLAQTPTLHYPMRIKYSLQSPDTVAATGWQSGAPFSVSYDGGDHWQETHQNVFFKAVERGKNLYKQGSSGEGNIHLHGLAIDPRNDRIMYAGSVHDWRSGGFLSFPLEGAHVFKSEDGGKTWKESDNGFPHEKHTAIHDIQIDPKNTNVIYVGTTQHEAEVGIGIYKSTDTGKTWKEMNNGLEDHALSVGTIAIHPEHTEFILAATHGGIYKSKNGGQSWTKTSSAASFDVEYVRSEPNIVYASTDEGVLKSKDFGETWYKVNYGLPSGEGQGIGVNIDGNVIYTAIKEQGFYISRIKPVTSSASDAPIREPHVQFKEPISASRSPSPRTRIETPPALPLPSPSTLRPEDTEEKQSAITPEESPSQKESPEQPPKKASIVTRIINFFKRFFSLRKE